MNAVASIRRRALAATVCIALVSTAGCNRNLGPATTAYLIAARQMEQAMSAGIAALPKTPPPRPPALPSQPTRPERHEYAVARRRYPAQLQSYYEAQASRFRDISSLLAHTQQHLAALNADGVDPAAVQLITAHERLLGDGRMLSLEGAGFFSVQQVTLYRAQHPEIIDNVILAGLASLAEQGHWAAAGASAVGGLLKINEALTQGKPSAAAQNEPFHDAAAAVQRDRVATETLQAQVTTDLSSKYPGTDWAKLLADH